MPENGINHNIENQNNPEIDKTFIEGENFEEISHSVTEGREINPDKSEAGTEKTGRVKLPDIDDIKNNPDNKIYIASGYITDVLGTGGMAKIYKVWNEKLEIFRAVKVLLPNQDENIARRFETEAKITAKLDHKNIIKIFNVGEWNNLPYIEMEYINGISISTMIDKFGKIEPPVCCAVAMALLKALSYASRQEVLLYGKAYKGIIHRDLKPANIMVTRNGTVILMDFGIARPAETSLHTMEGNIVGTLPYLSPEQLDNADINYLTDIYSFGTIIYEMLTGEKTFPQQTITNLIKNKATGNYRKFDKFEFQIDSRLSRTINRCLEAEKEKRASDYSTLFTTFEKIYYSFVKERPEELIKSFLQGIPFKTSRIPNVKNISFKNNRIVLLLSIPGILIVVASALFFIKGNFNEPQETNNIRNESLEINSAAKTFAEEPIQNSDTEKDKTESERKEQKTSLKAELSASINSRKSKPPVVIKKAPKKSTKPAARTKRNTLSILEKKYGTDNVNDIISKAWSKKNHQDILNVLNYKKAGDNYSNKHILYILNAYIQQNRYTEAIKFISDKNVNDAYFDLARGKIEDHSGNNNKALRLLQSSITKPSLIYSNIDIRREALYCIARLFDKQYSDNRSEKNISMKLKAWENVKNLYKNNPDNNRFKTAQNKIELLNKLLDNGPK